jgi:hypothetical protein
MIDFFNRSTLKKDNLKGLAKLMFQDVSDDPWDKENLTKRNLDFSIESVRYIDMYVKRLMGSDLLHKHFNTFVIRLGAYIGEVIKSNIKDDFYWYEFDSVYHHSNKLEGVNRSIKEQSVLYSQSRDNVILPMEAASQVLKGSSSYPNFVSYVEDMVKQHS